MDTNDKKKICVLFGAGADSTLDIPTGENFAKAVVGIDVDDINSAIDNYYCHKKLKTWYSSYSNESYSDEKFLKACIKKKILESENFVFKRGYDDEINNLFKKIKDCRDKSSEIINKYPSYMGILDENFHALINPRALGPKKFWRVITAYTRAYLFLAQKIFIDKKFDYNKILSSPELLLDEMDKYSKNKHKNYYSIIKKLENEYDFNIITTNYTTFCENITGIDENRIAYVHGKFEWFENPRTLQVIDIKKERDIYDKGISDEDLFFPYIFVQSGVKPIVDKKQIKEYAKMIDFFDKADVIFILGYRLNCDDNHINSIIRSAICNDKKVTYFNYENDLDYKTVIKRLRLDKADEYKNLIFKDLHKEECFSEFQKQLQQV